MLRVLGDRLQKLEIKSHELASEANAIRQQIEDSTIIEAPQEASAMSDNGTVKIEVMQPDEWVWGKNGKRRGATSRSMASSLIEALSLLTKVGDGVRVGPFKSATECKTAQSQIGHAAYDYLNWPRIPVGHPLHTGARNRKGGMEPEAPYESHVDKEANYLHIRRIYIG